jgi:hypothetical protein
MANESTYALISSILPSIWEAALMFARQNFIMPGLVTTFTDQSGMQDRKFTVYADGTVVTGLGETTDLTTQALSRTLLATLTPTEIGTQYIITDRRLDSDDVMNVVADMAQIVGYDLFKQVEADLTGLFDDFTAGTVGAAGSALTWTNIYQARARLAYNKIAGPYNVVLSEYQYYDLATALNVVGTTFGANLRIREEIQSRYYVGSVSDMDFYTVGADAIASGTAVFGGMFSRQAVALDVRRGMRIEPERDASLRHTEYNATMIYAKGAVRPSYGVAILSDASAP